MPKVANDTTMQEYNIDIKIPLIYELKGTQYIYHGYPCHRTDGRLYFVFQLQKEEKHNPIKYDNEYLEKRSPSFKVFYNREALNKKCK